TNFPEYQGPEKIVIRRYSDFVWLRDRIFEKYKGIFIPPLPEKSTVDMTSHIVKWFLPSVSLNEDPSFGRTENYSLNEDPSFGRTENYSPHA
ncbi:sorting nexin 1, partial [Tanacetum coccineum]